MHFKFLCKVYLILIQVHLELRLDDSAPSLTSHCITKMSVDSAWPSLTYMTSPMVTDRIPEVSVLIVIIPDKIYVNIGLMMTEEEVKGQSFKGYISRFSLSLCRLHYVQYCSLFNALREHGN